MRTITLELDSFKQKALIDALNDHKSKWEDMLWDCRLGKRPNMSPEGGQMILDDILNLIDQVGSQTVN